MEKRVEGIRLLLRSAVLERCAVSMLAATMTVGGKIAPPAAAHAPALAMSGASPSGAATQSQAKRAGEAAAASEATRGEEPFDLARYDLVDLTHPFDTGTIFWPTAPSGFELKRLSFGKTDKGFFYSANSFSMPEHGGTHLDAPIHFSESGLTAERIPLRQLIAPAFVIDVSAKAAKDPDYRATSADVEEYERRYGRIPAGGIALLRTGWSRRWPDRKAYLGDDTPGNASHLHFPSLGLEAVKLLVEGRKVGAIGVDVASIDYGPSADFPVHQLAAGHNVPGLENLTDLEKLPPRGALLVALPMKIAGGSGGPLRAIALVPRAGAR